MSTAIVNDQIVSLAASKLTGTVSVTNGGTAANLSATGGAGQVLKQSSVGGAVTVAVLAGSDVTGAALTKADDTNITLTLGGTPTTALLRAASLTLGWAGTLAVSRGGIGVGTLASNGVLYGNGTGAVLALAVNAGAKLFLTQTSSAAPAWAAIVAGDVPTLNQNTSGSAATLSPGRTINGVAFDGTAAITVTAAAGTLTGTTLNATVVTSSLTSVGALAAGSISSGFGAIDIGTDAVTAGNINGSGILTMSGTAGAHTFTGASATFNRIFLENTTSGATATASYRVQAGTGNLFLFAYSQGYSSANAYEVANGGSFLVTTDGGLSMAAVNSAATLRLFGGSGLVAGLTIALRGMTIGAAALPSTGTDVIVFPDGTIPATMAANTAALYADDVAGTVNMWAIAEDGTKTRLSWGAPQTYTETNVTTDRAFNANATTLDEIADVLGTLIVDLRARGIVA